MGVRVGVSVAVCVCVCVCVVCVCSVCVCERTCVHTFVCSGPATKNFYRKITAPMCIGNWSKDILMMKGVMDK